MAAGSDGAAGPVVGRAGCPPDGPSLDGAAPCDGPLGVRTTWRCALWTPAAGGSGSASTGTDAADSGKGVGASAAGGGIVAAEGTPAGLVAPFSIDGAADVAPSVCAAFPAPCGARADIVATPASTTAPVASTTPTATQRDFERLRSRAKNESV